MCEGIVCGFRGFRIHGCITSSAAGGQARTASDVNPKQYRALVKRLSARDISDARALVPLDACCDLLEGWHTVLVSFSSDAVRRVEAFFAGGHWHTQGPGVSTNMFLVEERVH